MRLAPDYLWSVLPWAALALILGATLYYILGREIGAQGVQTTNGAKSAENPDICASGAIRPPPPLPADRAEAVLEKPELLLPEEGAPAALGLAQLRRECPTFSTDDFFKGVEISFVKVLEAFASGDKDALARWVDPDIAEAFGQIIDRRAANGEKAHCALRRIERLDMRDVAVVGSPKPSDAGEEHGSDVAAVPSAWRIEVGIYSWQTNYVEDSRNETIQGHEGSTYFQDKWTFEAPRGDAEGPLAWKVSATQVL